MQKRSRRSQIARCADAKACFQSAGGVRGIQVVCRRKRTQQARCVAAPHKVVIRTRTVSCWETVETVYPVRSRECRGNDQFIRVPLTVTICILNQCHAHARDPLLARVLHAVCIGVEPDAVPDASGCGRLVAKVGVDKDVTRSEYDRYSSPVVRRCGWHAEIIRIASLRVTARSGHHHSVGTCGQLVKHIEPRRIVCPYGDVSADVVECVVDAVHVRIMVKRNHHAAQASFTEILYAVAVRVDPDPVANCARARAVIRTRRRRPVVSEIRGHMHLPSRQRHSALVCRVGAVFVEGGVRRQTSG